MTVFHIVLLILSFLGYMLFLARKANIATEFIPILTVSSVICLLFIAGLLNILPLVAWVILFGGLAALLVELIRPSRIAALLPKLATPGTILFFLCICICAVLFRNGRLVHYDNFSHWGLIVKQMVQDDQMPNFTNTYITFQSYPPGSALFLYYISKFTGYRENIVIFTQAAMTAASILPIFAFLPKTNTENKKSFIPKVLCIFLSLTGTFLLILTCNVDIYSLLVDTLLPAMAAGMAAIALYYWEQPAKAALLTLPVSIATLLIKNTGLFFVLIQFILLLCLYCRRRKKERKKTLVMVLLHAVVPAFTQLVWSRHVAYVFQQTSSVVHKHTMSAEHYGEIFAQKSPEDIQNIIQSFLHRVFDFSENPTLTIMLILNIALFLAIVLHALFIKKRIGLLAGTLLAIDGIYTIYAGGLLIMYLFSMPKDEALYLASFDRYVYTILLYLLVPFVLCMTYVLIESSSTLPRSILACLLLFPVALSIFIQRDAIRLNTTYTYPESRVSQVDAALSWWEVPSAAVYCPASIGDGEFIIHCMRYKLLSSEISYLYSVPTVAQLQEQLERYKYLIVVDADENIVALLKDLGISDPGPGVYTAESLLPQQ